MISLPPFQPPAPFTDADAALAVEVAFDAVDFRTQLDAGDVDPVAEADVYLAYGRDLQAEEILRVKLGNKATKAAARVAASAVAMTAAATRGTFTTGRRAGWPCGPGPRGR